MLQIDLDIIVDLFSVLFGKTLNRFPMWEVDCGYISNVTEEKSHVNLSMTFPLGTACNQNILILFC